MVVAPAVDPGRQRTGLDVLHEAFADGGRRRSATQLLQEYLNAQDTCLWGIATDGRTLRLMRDNLSLTRPAYIEVDLAKIVRDGLYPDFSALWLLLHRSRFGTTPASPSDCPLERWREQGRQEGITARDNLRAGVEAALKLLGQGAIEHRDNAALREALASGRLSPQGFYEELLGAVYRLIFLFAAEDRDLLHPPETPDAARRAYAAGYGVGRLRERAVHRTAWNRHHDAWDGLRAVFRALIRGAPAISLPGLGGLFDPGRTPNLDAARIGNRPLMEAIFRLAWIRPPGQSLARVNWRDMETEELGSVYEGLLELIPEVNVEARTFGFRDTTGAAGTERKSSGSYYTPDALVRLVLDRTLDPLLDLAEAAPDPVEAILNLTVLDPACGSGHFLLGAARRMAGRIVALQSSGAPGREAFQHALRQVVSRCIYGVDRNPLAVELCKVALWIEALEPGRPLSFLDHRIVCGDSLIGVFDLQDLRAGVPDAAYEALTGDDKDTARLTRKWNKEQRDGKAASGLLPALRPPEDLIDEARAAAALPEDSVEAVAAKARAFQRLATGEGWRRRKYACDLFVAAFFAKKPPLPEAPTEKERQRLALARPAVPLTGHVWAAARGEQVYGPLIAEADRLAHGLRCLHWPLEFPAEMAQGGFDAVIGNPPWERIKLQEQEFFAGRAPVISAARNAAERGRMIAALGEAPAGSTDRALFDAFEAARKEAEAASVFAHSGVRFPLTGVGDVNTYALFAEAFAMLVGKQGRAGVLVPTGIATDSSTSAFFGSLIDGRKLATLIDFENRKKLFPAVDSRVKFSVLALGPADVAAFAFFLLSTSDLEDERRRFTLTPEQIARINPNTKTAPIFRTRADAALTAKIYDRVPVLIAERPEEEGGNVNPWGIVFQRMFDMSGDSGLFRAADQLSADGWQRDGADWVRDGGAARYVPLYEAKMIHHYDHRWATYGNGTTVDEEGARDVTPAEKADPGYEPTPRYWVPEAEVRLRAARVSAALKSAVRAEEPVKALKALADLVAAAWPAVHGRPAREADLLATLGRNQPWLDALGTAPDRWLRKPTTAKGWPDLQRKTPLDVDDLMALADAGPEPLAQAACLIDRKQPRGLMGWRDICRSTDERTVIATVFPKVGTGDTLLLKYAIGVPAATAACLTACLISLTLDFVTRQKIGGTHLKYNVFKQIAVLPPQAFAPGDLDYIAPRVLELTYTSQAMRPWAEDLGHVGPPFGWDEERRARLRAELDGFFARKYGLSREELRYVLDPADVHGPDFPSETFRGLRDKEIARFGEYRTRRLVLQAYDALEGVT
ncbi:MAG: N-6 DNA methylase [Defluviicoccus sp.]